MCAFILVSARSAWAADKEEAPAKGGLGLAGPAADSPAPEGDDEVDAELEALRRKMGR